MTVLFVGAVALANLVCTLAVYEIVVAGVFVVILLSFLPL